MTPCLSLIDPPLPGDWNMAVDEALLAEADQRDAACVRLYRWSEPTLSLGYFQAAADRDLHAASRSLPMVRRQSGGGALVHDRELTYSIALPASHDCARHPPALYRLVHDALIDALGAQGVAARPVGCGEQSCGDDPTSANDAASEPFLCFARRHPLDLITAATDAPHDAAKIVGSAQRRRRGALLQHGSLLLERSPAAPELPGVRDVTQRDIDAEALVLRFQRDLLTQLQLIAVATTLPTHVRLAAEEIRSAKYAAESWQLRR